jgi:NarL family two-component system response regulator LiaR
MIVDDHPCVRSGLAFSLSTTDDIAIVAEAASGEEAIDLCPEAAPDVVLMDLLMPGMGGIAAISALRTHWPSIRVIALSSSLDGRLIRDALGAGAIGYLSKDMPAHDFASAIRLAHQGAPSLAPTAAQSLVRAVATPTVGDDLTNRERDVLTLLADGLSNSEIAERLVLATATVKFHVRNIRAKLGATSRTQTVVVALQHHLIAEQPRSNAYASPAVPRGAWR